MLIGYTWNIYRHESLVEISQHYDEGLVNFRSVIQQETGLNRLQVDRIYD